ncbi:Hsp20/alpha crystallin family protein [Brevibacterium jeotgali]|uniref:HSP20 family protein n=1 Tax=Brevibacterium jeotgali TaxID=1262550 RepID=A0A2H1L1P6_9MICO|nr:Hsp20/alpha crystallin family protein [Brevibacterium jeotgali]TWC02814.1 heat shock protein Hsp20 [Brevibacterium jeotgali]SMY10836.1 HSP20 family protein [Brevibacterium jeotgali]
MAGSTFNPIRDIDRFFSEVTRTPNAVGLPMDLFRDGEMFVARIDMPGVDPSSIDVDVEDRTLTVRAERTTPDPEPEVTWLTRERPTGTFARQLTLGNRVAVDQISAEYSDGVLSLTIPVADDAKPRKISVAHADSARSGTVISSEQPSADRSAPGDPAQGL